MSTSVAKCTLSNSIAKSGACLETAPFVFTPALTSCATTETNSSLTPPNTAESSVSSFTTLSTNLWPRKNERARGRHARPFFLGPATQARMICLQQQLHSQHEVETSGKGNPLLITTLRNTVVNWFFQLI